MVRRQDRVGRKPRRPRPTIEAHTHPLGPTVFARNFRGAEGSRWTWPGRNCPGSTHAGSVGIIMSVLLGEPSFTVCHRANRRFDKALAAKSAPAWAAPALISPLTECEKLIRHPPRPVSLQTNLDESVSRHDGEVRCAKRPGRAPTNILSGPLPGRGHQRLGGCCCVEAVFQTGALLMARPAECPPGPRAGPGWPPSYQG